MQLALIVQRIGQETSNLFMGVRVPLGVLDYKKEDNMNIGQMITSFMSTQFGAGLISGALIILIIDKIRK